MIANTLEEISTFPGTELLRVLIVVHSSEDSELILIEPRKKVCRIGTVDSE